MWELMAPPYLRILSDVRMGNPVSLYRICDAAQISAIRDHTSTYDVSRVMQDACDNGVRRFRAEPGLFNFEASVALDKPLSIEGSGVDTIFDQRSITNKATFEFKSESDTHFIDGITFRNFVMRCQAGTFSEQQHFIDCSGIANAVFESLKMLGFRGDGIYLGSGVGHEKRHNKNVHIRLCKFDGVNRENRNAISVIDGDGVMITHNVFARCTRPNMPGPIDFEPNANPWHIIRGVYVQGNTFLFNGGNVGEVSFSVPGIVEMYPQDIKVCGNRSSNYLGTGSFLLYNANREFTAGSVSSDLRVFGNHAVGGCRPFSLINGKAISFRGNRWTDFKQAALIGFTNGAVRDVLLEDDYFTRVGTVGGNGIAIFTVDGLDLERVTFTDCGGDVQGAANAIQFNYGRSRRVRLGDLKVISPTGKTHVAIQKEAGHTFTPTTNRLRGAEIGMLKNNFAVAKATP